MKKILCNLINNNPFLIKQTIKSVFIILMVLLFTNLLKAQPPVFPGDPEAAPVDGGLSLLIVSGIGYGAGKIRAKRKRNYSSQMNDVRQNQKEPESSEACDS